ncbi:MAG: ABC transporter permease, partial [Bryobacteraceae bacterium]|nr:ABC transporter permease [Bryobacteraceae bacterium]
PISQNEFLLEGDYRYFREHQQVLEDMTSFSRTGECDLNEAEPQRLICSHVASNFLPLLGVRPTLGRNFVPGEDLPNAPRSALLSHGFWQRRFGGDPQILGRILTIGGRSTEVAGVLPRGFELPNLARADVLLNQPLSQDPRATFTLLSVIGRMKQRVSLSQADAALRPLFQDQLKYVPAGFAQEVTFHMSSLRDRQVRDYKAASYVLLGCVLALLLIACANVANLLMARAASRTREFAVRAAIGASRWRLIRQTLTESALLGACGGLAGLLLAALLLRVLTGLAPDGMERLNEAGLDMRVLFFTTVLSLLSGFLFGLAPALYTPGAEALNTSRTTGRGWRVSQGMVALQIALSFVLLTGAGLLLQSLWRMQHVPLGMNPENVMVVRVQLGQQPYATPAQQSGFLETCLERIKQLPGVHYAAMSDSIPLYGPAVAMIYSNIEVQGEPPPDAKRQTGGMTVSRLITNGYFEALGIQVVHGRAFTEEDRVSGGEYAIVDERLGKRLFRGQDPVGKVIRSGFTGPWRTIVGVSRPARNAAARESDDPEYYFLWRRQPQSGRTRAHFVIRSEAEPAELASFVRAQFTRLDPKLPITITTMEENLRHQTERPRFQTTLLVIFAAIGVLLAAVGQFGLISYLVTQRSAEIGLRMALGATATDVVSMVVRRTLAWTIAGTAAGLVAAMWLTEYLQPLLFGVQPRDATNASAVLLLLFAVSIAAAWVPSGRAARIDPAKVLRHN